MTPKNKYSEVQRIIKEGLMIILVEADYILEEQELTELSELRLKEIKKQTERVAKTLTEETPQKNEEAKLRKYCKAFLAVLREQNTDIGKELAGQVEGIAKIRTAHLGLQVLMSEFEKKIK